MLRIDNLVKPSPDNWRVAINGMRNAFKSWDKSDSYVLDYEPRAEDITAIYYINHKSLGREWQLSEEQEEFVNNPKGDWISWIESESRYYLGENDKKLLLNLCKAGDPSHRKVLRQLPVIFDITAPLYFFKQFDTYKIGTAANSTSTMHQLTKYPFKLEDFSFSVVSNDPEYTQNIMLGINALCHAKKTVATLNGLREEYLKTNDKKYWNVINELLPQSYNQTRTWSGNYEVLLNMIQQRKGHKLSEWQIFSDYMLKYVPLLKEIYEAVND